MKKNCQRKDRSPFGSGFISGGRHVQSFGCSRHGGKDAGRPVAIVSNDVTVLAATSSRFAGRKEGELKVLATQRGHSVIYLTALARIDGRVVGLVANQPMFNAGAMDTDGIDKVISFLCHCDSFNIPLLFFHDIPGFLVGKEAEMRVETESASINWQTGRPNFRR